MLQRLTLALLVLGVLADYHNLAVALDNLALFANSFDGRLNFHYIIPFLSVLRTYYFFLQVIRPLEIS